MIRSLFAILAAVLAGFALARVLEGAGAAALGEIPAPGAAPSAAYQAILVAGWFAGAFVAAAIALLLGRRWAPLGGLAAGVILFSAVIMLVSTPLSWLLWPGALFATAAGGYAAVKLLRARSTLDQPGRGGGLFNG